MTRASPLSSLVGYYALTMRPAPQEGFGYGLEITCQRPLSAGQMMQGRPLSQCPVLVKTLFALCGQAHYQAARQACEEAAGIRPAPALRDQQHLLVTAEALGEHLRKLLLEWPMLLGLPAAAKPSMAVLAPLFQGLKGLPQQAEQKAFAPLHALLTQDVQALLVGETRETEEALLSDLDQFRAWAQRGASPMAVVFRTLLSTEGWAAFGACRLQPFSLQDQGDLESLLRALAEDSGEDLCRQPDIAGSPREVGAVARLRAHPLLGQIVESYGPGLLYRLTARFLESFLFRDKLIQGLRAWPAQRPAPKSEHGGAGGGSGEKTEGIGCAAIETARGLLIHRVEMQQAVVRRYQILAPTEWNMHPKGAVAEACQALECRGLSGLSVTQAMTWVIESLDPCVPYHLTIADS